MTGAINADANALITHARGRYSDALVCDSIRYYVMHVGAVPDYVWGQMPWSGKWRADWATARDYRVKEAQLVAERLGDVGATLYQVAANYTQTDIDVSVQFTGINDDNPLKPFVDALERPTPTKAHPGGHLAPPAGFGGGNYTVAVPDNTAEGHALNQLWVDGRLNSPEVTNPGTITKTQVARSELLTEGRRKLWEFIENYYPVLQEAENIIRKWGPGLAKYPTRDFIDQARDAWPGVIHERADLLHVAANNYHTMRGTLRDQTDYLKEYWASPSASGSYYIYANALIKHLDRLAEEMEWLAEEGKKAARTLDELQLNYVQAGHKYIDAIIAQVKAYKDAAESLSKATEAPLNALVNTMSALASMMLAQWQSANDRASATLSISQTAVTKAPDLGSAAHDVHQPPASVDNGWRTGQWQPGRRGGVIPTA